MQLRTPAQHSFGHNRAEQQTSLNITTGITSQALNKFMSQSIKQTAPISPITNSAVILPPAPFSYGMTKR